MLDLVGIPCMASICNNKISSILWKVDKYKITLYWKAHTHKTTNNSTGETVNNVEDMKAESWTAQQKNLKHTGLICGQYKCRTDYIWIKYPKG